MSQENYIKDVDKSTFAVELTPVLLVFAFAFFFVYIAFLLIFHALFDKKFILINYLTFRYVLIGHMWPLILIFILGFLTERKIYRLMKEKPFAIVTNDKLILDFGKYSLSWDSVQSINIEGERKLTVTYEDKKRKKRICDLKWLSGKKEFISALKSNCDARNIPYQENEITLFSRILLFLEAARQFLFEY